MGKHTIAGVTVMIVETSNVGVKVGMVGRGVMDAVGVTDGRRVAVLVGVNDGVEVTSSTIGTGAGCPQAERRKIMMSKTNRFFLTEFSRNNLFHLNEISQRLVPIRPPPPSAPPPNTTMKILYADSLTGSSDFGESMPANISDLQFSGLETNFVLLTNQFSIPQFSNSQIPSL